jgi:hypothetical protein
VSYQEIIWNLGRKRASGKQQNNINWDIKLVLTVLMLSKDIYNCFRDVKLNTTQYLVLLLLYFFQLCAALVGVPSLPYFRYIYIFIYYMFCHIHKKMYAKSQIYTLQQDAAMQY